MGKWWHYYIDLTWPNLWFPFKLIGVSFHLMPRFFLFPSAWGAADYILVHDYPEGAVLTREVYWQWMWFQLRIKPKVVSQAEFK